MVNVSLKVCVHIIYFCHQNAFVYGYQPICLTVFNYVSTAHWIFLFELVSAASAVADTGDRHL